MGNDISDIKNFQSGIEKHYAGDVDSTEAWEILSTNKDAILVDVRTTPEWMFAGVPDLSSLNKEPIFISWRVFPEMGVNESFVKEVIAQREIRKDCPILFLCKVGGRSLDAALEMAKYGYTNCFNIAGGFEGDLDNSGQRGNKNGWKSCNLPWEQR